MNKTEIALGTFPRVDYLLLAELKDYGPPKFNVTPGPRSNPVLQAIVEKMAREQVMKILADWRAPAGEFVQTIIQPGQLEIKRTWTNFTQGGKQAGYFMEETFKQGKLLKDEAFTAIGTRFRSREYLDGTVCSLDRAWNSAGTLIYEQKRALDTGIVTQQHWFDSGKIAALKTLQLDGAFTLETYFGDGGIATKQAVALIDQFPRTLSREAYSQLGHTLISKETWDRSTGRTSRVIWDETNKRLSTTVTDAKEALVSLEEAQGPGKVKKLYADGKLKTLETYLENGTRLFQREEFRPTGEILSLDTWNEDGSRAHRVMEEGKPIVEERFNAGGELVTKITSDIKEGRTVFESFEGGRLVDRTTLKAAGERIQEAWDAFGNYSKDVIKEGKLIESIRKKVPVPKLNIPGFPF